MKIEENVPIMIPKNMMLAKGLRISPPIKIIASMAIRVVREVIIVLESITFKEC